LGNSCSPKILLEIAADRVSTACLPCNMQAGGAGCPRRTSSEVSITAKVQAKSKLSLERHDSCFSKSTNFLA
jgi:hypothetical protein